MIQRKQTLFLLLSLFASIALFFIPCNFVDIDGVKTGVSVSMLPADKFQPNSWHYIGATINILAGILSAATIFFYKNRGLQVKLCYVLAFFQAAITLIVSFLPVVALTEGVNYESSLLATITGLSGIAGALFSVRYIKKDIALLKSADRIR